jgi:hypothetical protein
MIKPIIHNSRSHRNRRACVCDDFIDNHEVLMMDARRQSGEDDLELSLREYVDQMPDLSAEKRGRLLDMALDLHGRRLPTPFIFASIRSTAAVLTEWERDSPGDAVMARPEVRDFIEANAGPQSLGAEIDPRKDVKSGERERLRQSIIAAVRDARRSKARHEIKKTRNVLMKIDQRHVRRALGREGDELCHEISRILRATAALF